ncbi:MAG TPA: hypothetical protein VJO16_20850 [Candidatus Acidoferrum sp.]|nr:hypothetical protein [Candidatus Acidoferrum sp.]
MGNPNGSPPAWRLVPADSTKRSDYRRWNAVIILSLGLLVLAVLLAAIGANLESKGAASMRPAPVDEIVVPNTCIRL